MAKHPTLPTLYDEVKTLTITNLKKWGYLIPNSYKSGIIHWGRHGQRTSSINILVDTYGFSPYLQISYTYNGTTISYKVPLTFLPANIGKGQVWYFVCPHTQKRCRTLYMIGDRFLHRSAYTGCMYESQTKSHKNRTLHRLLDKVFGEDELYEQLFSKHFKSSYAGKPTKRYLAIQKKLRQAQSINYDEVERLL
ncbi:hypothetical protein TH63_00355 [Rufibacter radiotolerans]|uniref:Uncharacterized protein n=1 Tax=Rufibacter radiotolerans TaxID=1379910 RepID=A0A0H4W1Y1_9BACT|nr:hypothetical protein [Rufibacter radiotolerans]AKQ44436.1 hypothetical protein TH63_00355 [Rufibacter radiotolerans]